MAEVLGLDATADRKRIKKMIETWLKSGALVKGQQNRPEPQACPDRGGRRMGKHMMCVTTPKTGVTQGDATTPENRCVTTTTPKGGVGGGDAASPVRRGVVRNLVPMPRFSEREGSGVGVLARRRIGPNDPD